MIPLISLSELKNHLRVSDTDDDGLILTLAAAAICEGSGKTNFDWNTEYTPETLPEALKIWVFMRVAGLYEVRSDVQVSSRSTVVAMPRTFADSLLDRFWKAEKTAL